MLLKTIFLTSIYAWLLRPKKESFGKWAGTSNKKINNHRLKYASSEAATRFLNERRGTLSLKKIRAARIRGIEALD